MIKMNNVNLSKRSEMRETTRSCIGSKNSTHLWYESKLFTKVIQK
jgi:hypothetical protein